MCGISCSSQSSSSSPAAASVSLGRSRHTAPPLLARNRDSLGPTRHRKSLWANPAPPPVHLSVCRAAEAKKGYRIFFPLSSSKVSPPSLVFLFRPKGALNLFLPPPTVRKKGGWFLSSGGFEREYFLRRSFNFCPNSRCLFFAARIYKRRPPMS